MRFTVTWDDDAQADLTSRWLSLPPVLRSHLRKCTDHIDAALRQNAHQKGAVLKGSEPFRFYAAPIFPGFPRVGVVYEASLDDRLVRVLQLWVLSEDWNAFLPHG